MINIKKYYCSNGRRLIKIDVESEDAEFYSQAELVVETAISTIKSLAKILNIEVNEDA